MFNPNMEHVNLRATFGACRDFDCDTSLIKDLQRVTLGNISLNMAAPDYYSQNMSLNALPTGWFDLIMGKEKEVDPSTLKVSTSSPNLKRRKAKDLAKSTTSPKKVSFPRSVSVPKPPLVTHDE